MTKELRTIKAEYQRLYIMNMKEETWNPALAGRLNELKAKFLMEEEYQSYHLR